MCGVFNVSGKCLEYYIPQCNFVLFFMWIVSAKKQKKTNLSNVNGFVGTDRWWCIYDDDDDNRMLGLGQYKLA